MPASSFSYPKYSFGDIGLLFLTRGEWDTLDYIYSEPIAAPVVNSVPSRATGTLPIA